ncbi:50S ribosomal protein L16 3-hydroxylase [Allopseudospirillum japonicum]|uniref:50S ribosomal protein L16 3-hydroxylase n=1 Tax=Allopseudospirillum japonicum TaxID=64971 RepID=A0A1H6SVI9_9GAMM|nr:cupin domain-containing protein [Allopseudospirillum japonicum]SEI71761.1 50S ribosomal protein L16 3-hydroxylase [Allopseudospirillum japonicum]
MLPLTTALLGDMSRETFLRDYWQKKPLLIRQAIANFQSPLSKEEVAGLAMEKMVESRLVLGTQAQQDWQVQHGPFDEHTFAQLPAKNWTLLVQAVDHYVPEVAALLDAFDFIPRWRLDDIMISYAVQGGSVGPHLDYYDVFLLQAAGSRRWQLGEFCSQTTPILADAPLRILQDFTPVDGQDWVLHPGDLLYLPPALAHYGLALDDECMTWSVGFRAPSAEESLSGWIDYIAPQLSEDLRYTDPDLNLPQHPAQIDDQAITRMRTLLTQALHSDEQTLRTWFGLTMTQTKYADQLIPAETPLTTVDVEAYLQQGGAFILAEGSRLAWVPPTSTTDGQIFVDGHVFAYPRFLQTWIESISRPPVQIENLPIDNSALTAAIALLRDWYNQGSILAADEF